MSSSWDSMVAKRVIRAPASTFPSNHLKSVVAQKTFVPLSDKECDALRLAGGCYRCRRTPASPGWVQHGSRNCPRDEAHAISPTPGCPIGAIIDLNDGSHPVGDTVDLGNEEEDDDFVAAVFSSCVLGNGSFSEGEEEYDNWY